MQSRRIQLYQMLGGSLIALQVACVDVSGHNTQTETDWCQATTPYTFGTNSVGELTAADCRLVDGSYIDFYATTLPVAGVYVFDMNSPGSDNIVLHGEDGSLLASHDDLAKSADTAIKVWLPAGNYILGAHMPPGSLGPYTLSSAAGTPDVTDCEIVFVTSGTSTTQNIQPSDCAGDHAPSDDYYIFLRAGQSITVTMRSSAFDARLELYYNVAVVAANDNMSATSDDAQFTFTPPEAGLFLIRAEGAVYESWGGYTLSID
jgi:hypothetical protein